MKQLVGTPFGRKRNVRTDVLPSKGDILRYYLWIDVNGSQSACPQMVEKIMQIWSSADIETVTQRMVKKCLNKLLKKYRSFAKNYNERKNTESVQEKASKFKIELKQLFDIAKCKCHESNCVKHKLSKEQRQFLANQRTSKSLKIPIKINRTISVDEQHNEQQDDDQEQDDQQDYEQSDEDSDGEAKLNFDENDNDPDYVPSKKRQLKYNTLKLEPVALIADRYRASDTVAAAITTAAFESVGFVIPENNGLVVDKRKVARSRDKLRNSLNSRPKNDFIGLYFDARKDLTLFVENEDNGVARQSFRKEEHVSLLGQPGNHFLQYISLEHGTALDFFYGITDVIETDFYAMGCDGTKVNTGCNNGVIRLYEKHLQHPLQWLICLLHFTELPLRALFISIDGDTTGPNAFSGIIGKAIHSSLSLPVVKFRQIKCKLPNLKHQMKSKELSTDQQYLYEMCEAILNGNVSPSLAKRKPGTINHARWLTLANNILRLYVGTINPTNDLVTIVTFILRVYAPSWFNIKLNNKCIDGSQNLWFFIKASRYLTNNDKKVVDNSIQTNAFFGHHENILLGMIRDDRKEIRELACQRILKARSEKPNRTVRVFRVPTIKFTAKAYYDLIDWKKTKITEPPLTKIFTDIQLKELASDGPASVFWNYPEFTLPNNTQSVERCVKTVTEVSKKVTGTERRNGYIRAKFTSRTKMPTFRSKRDYKNI